MAIHFLLAAPHNIIIERDTLSKMKLWCEGLEHTCAKVCSIRKYDVFLQY